MMHNNNKHKTKQRETNPKSHLYNMMQKNPDSSNFFAWRYTSCKFRCPRGLFLNVLNVQNQTDFLCRLIKRYLFSVSISPVCFYNTAEHELK